MTLAASGCNYQWDIAETVKALLKRLDKAIGRYYDSGETTGEINPP